jgi:hypothetical protein
VKFLVGAGNSAGEGPKGWEGCVFSVVAGEGVSFASGLKLKRSLEGSLGAVLKFPNEGLDPNAALVEGDGSSSSISTTSGSEEGADGGGAGAENKFEGALKPFAAGFDFLLGGESSSLTSSTITDLLIVTFSAGFAGGVCVAEPMFAGGRARLLP